MTKKKVLAEKLVKQAAGKVVVAPAPVKTAIKVVKKVKEVIAPAEQPPKKEKRSGGYKRHECPYCHKIVGNLGNHIRQKHPTEAPAPKEVTKESLLGQAPKEKKTPEKVYYCLHCRAELRKNENPCWKCGQYLNWGLIE